VLMDGAVVRGAAGSELCKVRGIMGREMATLRAVDAAAAAHRVQRLHALWDTLRARCGDVDARSLTAAAVLDSPTASACASDADPLDLPLLLHQWTRGMYRCGKALTPLLRDVAVGGEAGASASGWAAHGQAVAAQVEEHTTYVEVLTALVGTLHRHAAHRAGRTDARHKALGGANTQHGAHHSLIGS
jgi:hypothetical protein